MSYVLHVTFNGREVEVLSFESDEAAVAHFEAHYAGRAANGFDYWINWKAAA